MKKTICLLILIAALGCNIISSDYASALGSCLPFVACPNSHISSVNFNVIVNPEVSLTATPSGPICEGSPVTLSAGAFVDYLWNTGATTESITVSRDSTATYTVTVTDNLGATGSASAEIIVISFSPPLITSNGPTTVCQGTNVFLTTGSYSNYQWSDGNVSQTIFVNTSGNYVVTVTDANGCTGTSSALVHVADYPPLQTNNNSSSTTLVYSLSIDDSENRQVVKVVIE